MAKGARFYISIFRPPGVTRRPPSTMAVLTIKFTIITFRRAFNPPRFSHIRVPSYFLSSVRKWHFQSTKIRWGYIFYVILTEIHYHFGVNSASDVHTEQNFFRERCRIKRSVNGTVCSKNTALTSTIWTPNHISGSRTIYWVIKLAGISQVEFLAHRTNLFESAYMTISEMYLNIIYSLSLLLTSKLCLPYFN